ncbi:Opi1-domain-containing protein [Epithele typhae]|uniref:Opi1-domain-containing protein n=1 Tax=Epithele typhae TaxID=378194 RepID=UPI0020079C6A|nr:Opi1-domain-containing protein [Epithele typhae]KAH9921739.1 Opi1-domain-containing protein [Epithele typhae]
MALADQDESVRIAVRALGDMRSGANASSPSTSFQTTPALSVTSVASSPSLPSPQLVDEDARDEQRLRGRALRGATRPRADGADDDAEMAAADGRGEDAEWKSLSSRMTSLPIVTTALRAYEHSKASSRVVKYGAEMMESSVKSISRPVMDRLPVAQLDEFASRQLDRLGSYTRRPPSRDARSDSVDAPDPRRPWESREPSMSRTDSSSSDRWSREEDDMRSRPCDFMQSRTPTPHSSTGSQPERPTLPPASTLTQQADAHESQQVAQRSRWQAVFLEAGGISAALSEESMRRLRYCLQWLQYATTQIDAQILVLRNFIVSLQPEGTPHGTPISAQHLRTLQTAKRDVVDTIRQVVEVVSRYAGGALPEPARSRVRSFILCLPRRWAVAANTGLEGTGPPPAASSGQGHDVRGESSATSSSSSRGRHRGNAPYSYGPGEAGPAPRSRPASRATSPARGPTRTHSRQTSTATGGAPPTVDAANQAAQKIMTLATESLDMLRGVTAVFKDSLERADIWVERLRVVGLQRGQNPNAEGDADTDPMLNFRENQLPPFPLHARDHRSRTPSSPLSPYAPLTPTTPGTASQSGYSSPFFPLPRSSSASSLTGLPPFPGPLNLAPPPFDAPSPAGVNLDRLSLSSGHSDAGSRLATPKSALLGFAAEGEYLYLDRDRHGGARGEKRRSDADEGDAAVLAATALAGLAGAANGVPAKRIKQEEREVGMDVDG